MEKDSRFNGKLNIALSVASGVEKALKSELNRLGYGEIPVTNGEANLTGTAFDVAKLNINLRTADRVYIKLGEFTATDFNALFDGVYSIPFENYIAPDGNVLVDGRCVKSTLFAVTASQKIVKKAIVERMKKAYGYSAMPESGNVYRIIFKIVKDKAEILLNTSGIGLHKRGYRDMVGIAPIKETLASALILYSDFYYINPFLDPFCGSGTFAIESAKIALDMAPSISRKFDFNLWKGFPEKEYLSAVECAKDKIAWDRKPMIFASDIDKKAVELAIHHAKNAGVEKYITFERKDVKDLVLHEKNGTIVTNPPYGERVFGVKEAETAYKNFGKVMQNYPDWSQFVITPLKSFEKCFGKKADRKRKVYNADKECCFYYFYKKH